MRITPLDVRKQDFRKSVRGFDCDEVRAFLATLADEYEAVLVDNKVLRERITDQESKINEYQTMERTLRDTLMTAERVMQESKDNANREGDLVIQEARLTAKGILDECRTRTEELRREIIGLRKEKETYLVRFKGLAEAQINFIETHQDDFADLDQRLIEMADSVITCNNTNKKSTETTPESTETNENDKWRDYSPTSTNVRDSASATVDLVAMGVPIPAVPLTDEMENSENSEEKTIEGETVTP